MTEKKSKRLLFLFSSNTQFFPLLCLSPQITKQQLQQTKDRFQAFLNGDTQIVADEAFINAVQSYTEVPPPLGRPRPRRLVWIVSGLASLLLPLARPPADDRVLKWWLKPSAG